MLLRAEGAEVVTASTGREALECLTRERFDVLLTDLGLPDIPGELLIREALQTVEPRPRAIVVTGQSEPYLSRARAAGATAVFTKPIEWPELLRALLTEAMPADAA